MAARRTTCPRCGEPSGVRIVYGMPDAELFEQAERGLVAIGGCLVSPDNPNRRCLRAECGAEWQAPKKLKR